MESGKSLCPGGSKKAPGGLCSPSSAPPMEAPLSFQRWDLGSRQQMPSDKAREWAGRKGYSELCSLQTESSSGEGSSRDGAEGYRQPLKPHTTMPSQLSAETSLALGHKMGWEGRTRAGYQSHYQRAPDLGKHLSFLICKRGMTLIHLHRYCLPLFIVIITMIFT